MTLDLRSETINHFHLNVDTELPGRVQLGIKADGLQQTLNGFAVPEVNEAGDPVAGLYIQLTPDQIRELIDHLAAFASEDDADDREFETAMAAAMSEPVADMCGSGEKSCRPEILDDQCCGAPPTYVREDEPKAPYGYPALDQVFSKIDRLSVEGTLIDMDPEILKLAFGEDFQKEPERETILQEAQRIVHGPRRAAYGHPARNFGRIAGLWQGYLDGMDNPVLDATDVAMLMVLLKVARIQHKADRDGCVDICGYAACAAIINEIDPS